MSDVSVAMDSAGRYWSTHPSLSGDFLEKFDGTADEVVLIARQGTDAGATTPLPEGTRVLPLPAAGRRQGYRGVLKLARSVLSCRFEAADTVFVRIPELLGFLFWMRTKFSPAHVVANVVAEAGSWFPQGSKHPLVSRALSTTLESFSRVVVRRSDAVVYVTQESLQRRYGTRAPALAMTNARLPESWLTVDPAPISPSLRHLITVGHLNGGVKGIDILLRAFSAVVRRGLPDATLTIVGAGDPEVFLEMAQQLGVADRVRFTGEITDRRKLLELLRSHDLFVLASRSEGLPRAMIEAMCLGLPSIGSRVGGVEELVGRRWSFDKEDDVALAALLLSAEPHEGRVALSQQQLARARAIIAQAQGAPLANFFQSLKE
ncbi:glycosyltransferase [Terrabacter sp. NPDC080008]|uniref:glycosyltransferase n=1 Tax=Terrabacter sp. NPDC080008 TaxID=3155176 RepID=UPI00344FADE9